LAIDDPDDEMAQSLAQPHAASQRVQQEAQQEGRQDQSRARGPHPLPLFLEIAARHCAGDRARLARVLAGLRRYQAMAPAPARAPQPVVATRGAVRLRAHAARGKPVLVVPSLINPPTVLDLAPGRSLLAALAAAGLQPLMVDWGEAPEPLGLSALVTERLMPLLDDIGEAVPVLGYCLGGTLAAGLAGLAGAAGVSGLALLATPWNFGGYGAAARARLADWWRVSAPLAAPLGAVPMELLQPAFWSLDEAALVAKYARLADADAAALAGFAALEEWSNSGPPLSLDAAREMAAFFAEDAPGRGHWDIDGTAIAAERLAMPILDVVAMRDRIVPPEAAMSATMSGGGVGARLEIAAGHVGMIVGSRAQETLWAPLAAWLGAR
jgi:polyhydroxyalkanoate synthase